MGHGRVPGPAGHRGRARAKEQSDPRSAGVGRSGPDPRPTGPAPPPASPATPPASATRLRNATFQRVIRDNITHSGIAPVISEPGGRPMQDWRSFDWRRDFQIAGQACFHPRPLQPREQRLRQRMITELHVPALASALNQDLVGRAAGSGSEHAAYIFQGGRLGQPFTSGRSHGVDHHEPATRTGLIGYAHTHPASTAIRPPSYGSDFLDSGLLPVQLMIELAPRRVWALISPNLTCIVGLLGPAGFHELDPSAPQAGDIWEMFRTAGDLRAQLGGS